MSEQNDLTISLTALADTAAQTADMRPSRAIRHRARQRRSRQRAGIGAATVAVVATVTLTATGIHGNRSQPVTSPLPASKGFPTSMWLPADQYPLSDTYHWRAQRPVDATHEARTFRCQSHSWQSLGGKTSQDRKLVPASAQLADQGLEAAQKLVRFADTATAQRAYSTLEGDIQVCHTAQGTTGHGRGAGDASVSVTRTAEVASGSSWKVVTPELMTPSPMESHILLLQRGPVVTTVVEWNGTSFPTGYPTNQDENTLQQIAAHLYR